MTVGGIVGAVAAMIGVPAAAQTKLQWPSASVRVERYRSVEECLAAIWRVRDSVTNHTVLWRDTTALSIGEITTPLPAQVRETAQRCSARFTEPASSLDDFPLLLHLYLLADRDADAAALVKRRLAAVSPRAARERAAVLDTIALTYLGESFGFTGTSGQLTAQPARLATAEPYIVELGALTSAAPWAMRLGAYDRLMQAARRAGDTTRTRRAAEAIVAVLGTLTAADRRTPEASTAASASYRALGLLSANALLDSLRRSTAIYVALQRANWAKASGERSDALHFPIGEAAPAIEGTFWFQRGDSSTTRPTKGKVALVVFIDQPGCIDHSDRCWIVYSEVQRLKQRFPELEITLVAQTRGYISNMTPPPPPAAEADTLAHWWLDQHQIPGALAVTATDFWRLPDPDRRRIDRDAPNVTHYSFGRQWPVNLLTISGYVIDRHGTIVEVCDLPDRAGEVEAHLVSLLEALFAQGSAT